MRNLIVGIIAFGLCGYGCGENASSPSGAGGSSPQQTGVGGSGGLSPASTDRGGQGGGGIGEDNQTGGNTGAGGGLGGSDGGVGRLLDVANLEMSWSTGMDAGAGVIDIVVLPDGSATCRESFGGNQVLEGRLDVPDPAVATVLASPGVLDKLVTECPFRIADAGSTIITTLKTGERFSRLVFGTCSDDDLLSLVSALRRIGETCTHQAHPIDAL